MNKRQIQKNGREIHLRLNEIVANRLPQLLMIHFQLLGRFIFGKKRLACVFPNLSSSGGEQEKTLILNRRLLAAFKGRFFMGTKEDDFFSTSNNGRILKFCLRRATYAVASQQRPFGASAPLAAFRSRWSLDLREILIIHFQLFWHLKHTA